MTREEALNILLSEQAVAMGVDHDATSTNIQRKLARLKYDALCIAIYTLQESERKHGEWKSIGGFEPWTSGFHCSRCLIQTTEDTKYCPNCGAIMDGKEPIKDEQENQETAEKRN